MGAPRVVTISAARWTISEPTYWDVGRVQMPASSNGASDDEADDLRVTVLLDAKT